MAKRSSLSRRKFLRKIAVASAAVAVLPKAGVLTARSMRRVRKNASIAQAKDKNLVRQPGIIRRIPGVAPHPVPKFHAMSHPHLAFAEHHTKVL